MLNLAGVYYNFSFMETGIVYFCIISVLGYFLLRVKWMSFRLNLIASVDVKHQTDTTRLYVGHNVETPYFIRQK